MPGAYAGTSWYESSFQPNDQSNFKYDWICHVDFMSQDQMFVILFQGCAKNGEHSGNVLGMDHDTLKVEYDKATARMLYWIFLINLRNGLSMTGKTLSMVAEELGLESRYFEKMYVLYICDSFISIDGTSIPNESDVFKLVTYFELNRNPAIVGNYVANAFNNRHRDSFQKFCRTFSVPDADPIMVQLRNTLKRNIGHIWDEFVRAVSAYRVSNDWFQIHERRR